MSWTQILNFPFMQHALVAILFAGIAFPMIGVFILSLNLIPLRFAMMVQKLLETSKNRNVLAIQIDTETSPENLMNQVRKISKMLGTEKERQV